MRPITIANMIDANKTSAELLCNSDHFGQDTLVVSSSIEPCTKLTSFFIIHFPCARVERFELPSAVLETDILPLNYTRKCTPEFIAGVQRY
jgi:hypothetical protein